MISRESVSSSPLLYVLLAAALAASHILSASAFGATPNSETIGGRMTSNGCFVGGRVAKSYVTCVEKNETRQAGAFTFAVKAQAGYRDPIVEGGKWLDQAAVRLDVKVEDPTNVFGAFGEVPVVVESTICTDTWGCTMSTNVQTLNLVRPYGYRMLQGTLNYELLQDFAGNRTNRIVEVKVSLPGRSESASFSF